MTDDEKRHCRYGEILHHLRKLRDLLEAVEPKPIFLWTIESKIRAYAKKHRKTNPNMAARMMR